MFQRHLGNVTGQSLWPQINQRQMRVGAARYNRRPTLNKRVGQDVGVGDHTLNLVAAFRPQRLAKSNCLASDGMHQRSALKSGEYGRIEFLAERLVIAQDDTAPASTQRFVRC